MIARPLWHLGGNLEWTEQMQRDWLFFQRERQQKSFEQTLQWFESRTFPILMLGRILHDVLSERDWYHTCFLSMSAILVGFRLVILLFGPWARRHVRKQPILGSAFQVLLLSAWSVGCIHNALSMKSELMQHRSFIIPHIFLNAISVLWMESTFEMQLFVGAPLSLISWFYFHRMVNFPTTDMSIPAFFLAVFQTLLCAFFERLQWRQFHANVQLDRDRLALVSTQKTLHGMLSSFWDASCTCKMDGSILSSTPHLEQLLGAGRHMVGSSLYDFLSNESDSRRLQSFLQTTMSTDAQQASSLQCSMQPLRDSLGQESTSREVVVYGIKLPQGSTFESDHSDPHLDKCFIGIKETKTDMHVPDATDMTSDVVALIRNKGQVIDNDRVSWTSGDDALSDAISTEHGSLRRKHLDVPTHRIVESVSSKCTSLAYSMGSRSTESREHRNMKPHKSVQTIALDRPCTQSKAIQINLDDFFPAQSSSTVGRCKKSARRPPKLVSQQSSSTVSRHRVFLNTSQCALNRFQVTPAATAKLILYDALIKLNLAGKGCCFFHISLAALMRIIKDCYEKECKPEISPEPAWQCGHCFALNSEDACDDDDDEGDSGLTCIVCDRDASPALAPADGFSADNSASYDE